MPEMVEGETLARMKELLEVFQIWSSRRDQRLVPSDVGKFPMMDDNPTYDVATGASLDGKIFRPGGKPALPKRAVCEASDAAPKYCAPSKLGFAPINVGWCGVTNPEAWPGKQGEGARMFTNPKLSWPMLENPVSWRRVIS